eukprot:TRINITY_DN30503_c0_g1_i1.p1 TRINITY_DN30503_c0_g1~~TRINITY_DN30503_c0_g1_i1.p1  ORF type:complete len:482 (+),score=90.69 TRINITY_DN30503_c0_g1_i1:49-1494(+)
MGWCLQRAVVTARVPHAVLVYSKADMAVFYSIYVSCEGRTWTVERRYSEFEVLKGKLQGSAAGRCASGFPPKGRLFGPPTNRSRRMIEARRVGLERYLQQVMCVCTGGGGSAMRTTTASIRRAGGDSTEGDAALIHHFLDVPLHVNADTAASLSPSLTPPVSPSRITHARTQSTPALHSGPDLSCSVDTVQRNLPNGTAGRWAPPWTTAPAPSPPPPLRTTPETRELQPSSSSQALLRSFAERRSRSARRRVSSSASPPARPRAATPPPLPKGSSRKVRKQPARSPDALMLPTPRRSRARAALPENSGDCPSFAPVTTSYSRWTLVPPAAPETGAAVLLVSVPWGSVEVGGAEEDVPTVCTIVTTVGEGKERVQQRRKEFNALWRWVALPAHGDTIPSACDVDLFLATYRHMAKKSAAPPPRAKKHKHGRPDTRSSAAGTPPEHFEFITITCSLPDNSSESLTPDDSDEADQLSRCAAPAS